jgi:solute:Na+ symporter, SSS family
LNTLLIVLIALFLTTMLGIGFWTSKIQSTSDDFFVGGRRFGIVVTTATQVATAFGGGVMLAQVGIGYRYGFSVLIYTSVAVPLGVFLLAKFFAPWLRSQDFYTTTDWMCAQYGETKTLRGLTSIVVSFYAFASWVAQPIAAGKVLNVITGLPMEYGIILAAVIVIIYTMTGGIIAVAYTDVAQLGLMIIAIFILLPTVMMDAGGIVNVFATVPAENTTISAVGDDILFAWLLAVMPGQIVKQTYHQRVFSAKDEKTAKQGLYNLAIASVLAGVWAALLGMSIYTLNPTLVDQEHAAIWVIQNTLHPIVAALALAAIVAAVVSSADSSLHSASASLTRDFYMQIFKPDASDKDLVRVSKICVMAVGVVGIFIGISIPSVLEALLLGYSLSAAGLLFPLVLGHFWSGARRSGAIAGILLGVASTVFFKYSGGLPSFLPPIGAGLIASLVGTVVVSLLSDRQPQ